MIFEHLGFLLFKNWENWDFNLLKALKKHDLIAQTLMIKRKKKNPTPAHDLGNMFFY